MLRKALLATVVLTFFGTAALAASTTPEQARRISIVYFNCASAKDGVPTVYANSFADRSGKPPLRVTPSVRRLAYGIHALNFTLEPGNWFVAVVNANTRYCGSSDEVTVLPDRDRHIVAAGVAYLHVGPSCSVAGMLPVPGLSVRLINRLGQSEPVFVDDDAYYSIPFGRGKYDLEIRATGYASMQIPLDYSDQGEGEFCDKKIVRNITLDELRKLPKSNGSLNGTI